MKKLFIPLFVVFLFAFAAQAQTGARYDGVLLSQTGAPIIGATVRVCSQPASGQPCTPLQNIYSDVNLLNALPNPLSTDFLGNFSFYVTSGTYELEFDGPGILTRQIPDVTITIPGGGGGGAGNPSPPQFAVQVAGPGSPPTAFSTILSGGRYFAVDSTTSPTVLTVPISESICGPRPWNDVTCYGAKGDGSTDDTAAFQTAITTACATAGTGGAKPMILVPTGFYKLSQPQTGSGATSVLTQSCPIAWRGYGLSAEGVQFPSPLAASIIVTQGASPLDVPILLWTSANNNSSTSGITWGGYEKAIQVTSGANFNFSSGSAATEVFGTLSNGDCPITLSNTLYDYFENFTTQVQSTTGYGYCIIDTAANQGVGVITWKGSGRASVGCFIYYQANQNMNSNTGTWDIEETPLESCDADVIHIANPNSVTSSTSDLTIKGLNSYDSTLANQALIGTVYSIYGTTIDNSFAGIGGNGVAIRQQTGPAIYAENYDVRCSISVCVNGVVDQNGNPISDGRYPNTAGGSDYVSTFKQPFGNDIGMCRTESSPGKFLQDLPSLRLLNGGTSQALFAMDATCGITGGDGSDIGFAWSVSTPAQAEQATSFMNTYPPTSLTAAAGSAGGTLTAGTYTYNLRSTPSSGCGALASAPSATTTGVTIGANTQINLTWSIPITGVEPVVGYCLQRNPVIGGLGWIYIAGAGTTSYTDSGASETGSVGMPQSNKIAANPTVVITPNSTNILNNYTVAPGANLQAAIMAQDTAGGYPIYFSPGTYNLSAMLTLPDSSGHCVDLIGSSMAPTVFVATASMTAMISKGNSTAPYGCRIQNITFNGGGLAASFIDIKRGKGWQIQNLEGDNVSNGGEGFIFGDSTASVYFYEATIINLDCEFSTTNYPTASNRPTNCVDFQTSATDNQNVFSIVGRNTLNAAVRDYGNSNRLYGVHAYGSSQSYAPNYVIDFGGQGASFGGECDGIILACVNIAGNLVSVQGMKSENFYAGTTPVFATIASGKTNYVIAFNDWSGFSSTGTSNLVTNVNNGNGSGTIWGNYPDYNQNQMTAGTITLAQCAPGCTTPVSLNLQSNSATYGARTYLYDTTTLKWDYGTDAGTQNYSIVDDTANATRLLLASNGETFLNSESTQPVCFNCTTSGGTGGVGFGSGASATPVASVTVTGQGDFVGIASTAQVTTTNNFRHTSCSTLSTGSIAITGFGTGVTAPSAVLGCNQNFTWSFTSGGSGETSSPTMTVTLSSGADAWSSFPYYECKQTGGTNPYLAVSGENGATTTTLTLTIAATPQTSASYAFTCHGW